MSERSKLPLDTDQWEIADGDQLGHRLHLPETAAMSMKLQQIVPCACGSLDAYWHGPEGGLREYCCDSCWRNEVVGGPSVKEMKVIVYRYAGDVERCRKGGRYNWYKGYSENGTTYPWLTMSEARTEAKKRGARAVFT